MHLCERSGVPHRCPHQDPKRRPAPESLSLEEVIASRRERGEDVGIDSDDQLIEAGENEEELNNIAIDAAASRQPRQRGKQRESVPADVPAPKSSKRKRDETESDSDKGPVKPVKTTPRPIPKTKREATVVDSDEETDISRKSRHKSVGGSDLYNMWDGSTLADVRHAFQAALLARDGFPARTGALHRSLNLKQLLVAAKEKMDPAQYKRFKTQVEIAFNDTSKE